MTSGLVRWIQRVWAYLDEGRLRAFLAATAYGLLAAGAASAQDATNGRTLYNAILVSGKSSCAAGGCHSADPNRNQNLTRNGANRPDVIAAAIINVPVMNFLSSRLSNAQLADLAAYIANPAAAAPLPTAELSATALDFGSINLGATSNMRVVALRNNGNAPLQLSGITINNREFSEPIFGTCAPTSVVPVSGSCTLVLDFTPSDVGTRTGLVTIAHNALVPTSRIQLTGVGLLVAAANIKPMIEYYHAGLNYYFMTSRETDILLLDSRPDWTRTNNSFDVLRYHIPGVTTINRYYFDRIARNQTRGTHFYTLEDSEKEGLNALNPLNAQLPGMPYNEGIDSYAFLPLVSGVGGRCAAGQRPVYRVFRGQTGFPDDPNHRFTTDLNLYNAHVAQGWDGEGVKLCVPTMP